MNEAETRMKLIDPQLRAQGWDVAEGAHILCEYYITPGRIETGGRRGRQLKADYLLEYRGIKLAVVEAKSAGEPVGQGVGQAKDYAIKLGLDTAYAANGREIYQICLKTGVEGLVPDFLSPEALWQKTYGGQSAVFSPQSSVGPALGSSESQMQDGLTTEDWRLKFAAIPFDDKGGAWQLRYYQELAVRNTLEAVAAGSDRILLTLATGTGKTAIAFQIAWKLFHARWNLVRDGSRRPRILFLADRNILADQAYNAFSAFPDDALVRIKPGEIRKNGRVPTNGSVFFTIFQTFMSGMDEAGNPKAHFGQYPPDYFDFIIIDECHRGGANDESTWRGILEYFAPAVQLGLTATPKRDVNADTYAYFGAPVYVYSLREGIEDGFLTPFKVKRISTTLDEYVYTSDDTVVEGEIEAGRVYTEPDFNRVIEIKERERKRVEIYLREANQREKAIIFCATQDHAAAVRDLVNQLKTATRDPNYCVRVTADDGELGEQFLRTFQDNEKTIPTILTTSQKLSTGVDARNIRNIVLLRPVNSMVEFKQIIGRGTRLFDGKEFFTIYDFVGAYKHFYDREWDGDAIQVAETRPSDSVAEPDAPYNHRERNPGEEPRADDAEPGREQPRRIRVMLRDGKEREIQYMVATSFWSADGRPISAREFLEKLFGELPTLFRDEAELRALWSNPLTRRALLQKLDDAGFGRTQLELLQRAIDAEKSDLFDVLEYVMNGDRRPLTRAERAAAAQRAIFAVLDDRERQFLDFVLAKYVESGVDELDEAKLPTLLVNKYHSLPDAVAALGTTADIRSLFVEFQRYLYEEKVA